MVSLDTIHLAYWRWPPAAWIRIARKPDTIIKEIRHCCNIATSRVINKPTYTIMPWILRCWEDCAFTSWTLLEAVWDEYVSSRSWTILSFYNSNRRQTRVLESDCWRFSHRILSTDALNQPLPRSVSSTWLCLSNTSFVDMHTCQSFNISWPCLWMSQRLCEIRIVLYNTYVSKIAVIFMCRRFIISRSP